MIKFFRRLRHRFILEGKTTKYLSYAIGEIVLVVIGILIALSINDWNERRKFQNLEISTLVEIQKGLYQALSENKRAEGNNISTVEQYNIILDHIENKQPFNVSKSPSFRSLLAWQEPDFNYAGFDLFKSRGPDLITNDSIKIKLLLIYEEKIQYLVNDHNKTEWNYNNTVMTPFFTENFEVDLKSRKAIPNDYNALLHDQLFKNKLTYLMSIRLYGIDKSQELSLLLEELINDITAEIERLQNE